MAVQRKRIVVSTLAVALTLLTGTTVVSQPPLPQADRAAGTDKRIVDCLLQGQIRKIGDNIYQAPPRPVKLPATECDIRGGDMLVYDRSSFSASLSHWLQLAKEGDVSAQIYVGEIFERGLGREPDYAQAAAWYKTAADAGNPAAQISLAQLYEKGLGVQQNAAEAERLYQLAFRPAGAENVGLDPGSLGNPAERVAELEQQLAKAQKDATALSEQLGASQQTLAKAQSSLSAQQADQARLRKELEAAKSRVGAASPDAAALQAELAQRESLIAQLQEEVDRGQLQTDAYQQQLDRNSELEKALTDQAGRYETATAELSRARAALAESNRQLTEQQSSFDRERQELELARASLERSTGQSSAEQKALQEQVAQREATVAAQAASLEKMQAEISTYTEQSRELQNELTVLRRQNETLAVAQSDAKRYRDESSRLQTMLDQAQAQLAVIEKNKSRGAEELARVQAESARYQDRLAVLEEVQASLAQLAGPAINVIEPAAFDTRGGSDIRLKGSASQQVVVGKISAPAGLLSLTVNQQPIKINDSDIFESVVSLKGPTTLVQIVAIDTQGKRAESSFNLISELATTVENEEPPLPKVDFGKFYALLIGNNDYELLPDLQTPRTDIKALDVLLRERYGFTTTLVENGTREQIMDSMYELLGKLTSEDNLLIYYAGHGEYVTDTDRGVWLPIDANPQSPANWISNVEINDYLKQIRAKQIIVIADSCYSGSLDTLRVDQLATRPHQRRVRGTSEKDVEDRRESGAHVGRLGACPRFQRRGFDAFGVRERAARHPHAEHDRALGSGPRSHCGSESEPSG